MKYCENAVEIVEAGGEMNLKLDELTEMKILYEREKDEVTQLQESLDYQIHYNELIEVRNHELRAEITRLQDRVKELLRRLEDADYRGMMSEDKIKELESETDYMESLSRAKIKADDEWSKAVARVKKLEFLLKEEKSYKEHHAHCEQALLEVVSEKDGRIRELKNLCDKWAGRVTSAEGMALLLESRVKELKEGIDRHRKSNFKLTSHSHLCSIDKELYKLLEGR